MHPKLQQILDAANKATPGPWFSDANSGLGPDMADNCVFSKISEGNFLQIADYIEPENATYIALCNPETVKKLVEVINYLQTGCRSEGLVVSLKLADDILNSIGGRE